MYFLKIIFLYFDQFCIGVSVAVKRESTKSSCIWLRSSTVKRILSTFLRILSTYCKLPFADKQWTLEKNIGYYVYSLSVRVTDFGAFLAYTLFCTFLFQYHFVNLTTVCFEKDESLNALAYTSSKHCWCHPTSLSTYLLILLWFMHSDFYTKAPWVKKSFPKSNRNAK